MTSLVALMKHFEALIVSHSNRFPLSLSIITLTKFRIISTCSCISQFHFDYIFSTTKWIWVRRQRRMDGRIFNFRISLVSFKIIFSGKANNRAELSWEREMTKIAFWKEFNCIHCAEWASYFVCVCVHMRSFIMNLHSQ